MAQYAGFMLPNQVFEERVIERAMWLETTKEHRDNTSKRLSRDMAETHRSDPFTYDRVASHLKTGMHTPDDFRPQVRKRK